MRNLSSKWKEKIKNEMDVRYLKYADITLADGTVINLTNADLWQNGMAFEDSVSGDSSFDIGSAIINVLTLSINNFEEQYSSYDFDGAEVVCYIGLELDDGTIEKIRICTATVIEQPEDETVSIDLTCEDNMRKFDRDYSESELIYPATREQIVRDACNVCGVTLQTVHFDNDDYVVKNRPSDDALTFRQVLQWVAQIGCQWMRCDEYGRLCVKWYDTEKTDTQEIDTTYGFTPQHTDVVITGVRVTEYSDSSDEETGSYMVGTQGYVLVISDNKLIRKGDGKTVASMIAEKCAGMIFRPFESQCPTDVALEAGDTITIEDRNGNLYNTYLTTTTLHPGAGQNIACNAKSAAKNSSTRYSQLTQAYVEARKMVKAEKTARENALEEFGKRIETATGVYTTVEKQEDGSNIFYLHDKPKLSESQAVWKMTSQSWGVSTDGGKTWNGGMTVDGDAITRILNTVGINADWINSGQVSGKFIDGKNLRISTKDGQVTLYINENGQVFINPSTFFLSDDKTIDAAIAEKASEEVKKMTSLNVVLSNEYQGIPTDADGNYTTFPACSTTLQALFGTEDVTADAEYAVTEQDITGTWDADKHTYTATGISADVGYAEFTVTYKEFSIKKQFTIAKQKQGTSGADAVTYYIDSDATVVVRSADGTYTPKTILFKNYEKTGKNAKLYNSHILIQTTTDGTTFTTYASTMLTSGQYTLLLSNISSDVTAIRYTFKDNSLPPKTLAILTIPIINDTELTEQQIFNLLTDNGARDILTYVDGKLFLNGTYIKGKTIAADKLNVTDLVSLGAKIAGWTINNTGLQSKADKIKLLAEGKIQIGNVILASDGDACTVKYGLHIYAGTDTISDGTDKFKVFNLNHVTSGGHLVFASDGATVSYLSSSSKRYKNHVANMTTDEAKKVLEIPIVWFKYKDGYLDPSDWLNDKEIPGFYAEDAYKAFPEAAQLNEKGQPEDWNYRTIIPAMLKVMQDQQKTIDNLVKRVEKLEGSV